MVKESRDQSREAGELLLEIGTEELPYQFVAPALTALSEAAERRFKEQRLAYGGLRTFGTPRRLVLVVEGLAARQEPAVTEVMGPSKAVAFDSSGRPTKAALGFAASHQIPVEDLAIRHTPKGDYVCAIKQDPGRATATILSDLLASLIRELSFPKAMRWNATGMRFARPIRWIVALYAGKVIDLSLGGVQSGNRTQGHRALGSGSEEIGVQVSDLSSYLHALERQYVMPEQDTRRAEIVGQLKMLASSIGGIVHHDDDLLEQAVYTVEWPHAVLGTFESRYLSLPKEVLMTAMKEHQGFFSLVHDRGDLLPAFISVTNMPLKDMRLIREGNERVLAARLADARFFFDDDRKTSLAARVDRLNGVIFHHKLGTMHQKTERLKQVVQALTAMLDVPELEPHCLRAAELSKTDLLTGMVGEFPMLQGIMGGEYARHDGEADAVSRAIREQYLPSSIDGEIPKTTAGKILSLADRLDSITAFFHVGVVPTGSEDPLGLRRHALAIVRIVVESPLRLNLVAAVAAAKRAAAAQQLPASGDADPQDFIADRLRYYGRTVHRLRDDIMEAVLTPALRKDDRRNLDLADLLARMKALQDVTARQEFDPLMIGFKRAHRIVEKERWSETGIDPALFQHPAEHELYKRLTDAKEHVPGAIARGEYGAALDGLVQLKPAIDGFFNGVMVNADDQALRANRLSLLEEVDRLFAAFADFSHIAVPGS